MHAANPRIGIQGTIFSEHEVFGECCHFFIPFRYSCKKMQKLSVLITKYIICPFFS